MLLLQNSRQIDLGAEGVSILLRTGQETDLTDKVRLTWREFFPRTMLFKDVVHRIFQNSRPCQIVALGFPGLASTCCFPKVPGLGFCAAGSLA